MNKPKIVTIQEKKLVGIKIRTSLAENRTFELWNRFKKEISEIPGKKDTGYYAVQIFDENLGFDQFTPQTFFEKWAAVEVESLENIPEELETFLLPAGKYAVFIHKGLPETFPNTSQYIFGEWLPNSGFEVDDRPHFEIMADDYRADDPEAEEEVFIPIQ